MLDDILGLVDGSSDNGTSGGGEAVATLADWVRELRAAFARVVQYRDHLQRWAWQDVREEQYIALAKAAAAEGKVILLLTIDFKEKLQETMRMRAVQSQYWEQKTVSMLCVHIRYWSDGELKHVCLDFVADDTSQDGVWVSHAFALLPVKLAAMFGRVDGVVGSSDNASHFHGAMFFAHTLLDLARALRVKLMVWNFYEAGEGKVSCCLQCCTTLLLRLLTIPCGARLLA